ncbi:hypothetical protein [Streptomyces mirabilis]|uniref:hypothetical protein n=1 Tax=Streptomyces mirabilis TaxID=68239 RepID=UPI00339DF3FF
MGNVHSRVALALPLRVGAILEPSAVPDTDPTAIAVPAVELAVSDPAVVSVPAAELAVGDEIPSWPNGRVTRAPYPRLEGRVDVEINGVCLDVDAHERVAVVARYGMAVPRAFVKATRLCWPDAVTAILVEHGIDPLNWRSEGTRPLWLPRVTYAEAMALADLAALIEWECLQEPGPGSEPQIAEAARTVASPVLHPQEPYRRRCVCGC